MRQTVEDIEWGGEAKGQWRAINGIGSSEKGLDKGHGERQGV